MRPHRALRAWWQGAVMTAPSTSADDAAALPVYTKHVKMPLHLSPAFLDQPMEGIREQLNRSVMRYVEAHEGVLLSYTGLRMGRPTGRISYDAPEIHVRVEFEAKFFSPKVDNVIQGTVSRIGHDHIALLVMGVFNATVPLPAGWDPDSPSLQPDQSALFVVNAVKNNNGLLTMTGELTDAEAVRRAKRRKAAAARRPAAAPATPSETSSPAPAPTPAPPSASTEGSGVNTSGKRKRTPEEKEARKIKKAKKAAKKEKKAAKRAAAAAAASSSSAAE